MKRTFLSAIALAALMAGLIHSPALADGFKFGGRSFGGGGGGNGPSIGRNLNIQRNIGQSLGGLNSNGGQQIKKFTPHIKPHGSGSGIGGINLNQGSNITRRIPGLNSGNPIVGIKGPKVDIKKNTPPFGGQLGGQLGGLQGKIDPKFGQDKKLGIHIGNGGIQIGGPGGVKIGKSSGGIQKCLPQPDHCHKGKDWNAWCDPHHWPCYKPCYPCHKPICYQETVYVYSQPVVVAIPATPVEKLMQIPVGATLTLQVPNMGEAPGQVVLQMEKVAMASLVHDWKLDTVTATLPPMELAAPVVAEILILRADGSLANGMKVELIPAAPGSATAVAPATAEEELDAASQATAALGL